MITQNSFAMKKIILIVLAIISVQSFAQTTKSFMWDGTNRQYIEYVPSVYSETEAVPLVICLHGLGDNMTNFSGIGMQTLSEYENFIVLTPQALVAYYYTYEIGTAWNSGASYMGIVLNQTVDDVGFLSAMIDSTKALYNIDPDRIYVTGFSMGGFMCHKLACEMNSVFAAVASVAGTIGNTMTTTPELAMPVCHFHGTADSTVLYVGNEYGNDAEELVNYWITKNNCDPAPSVNETLPDIAADGYTVDHYIYSGGDYSSEVEFYKVIGADHEWLFEPSNDITYTIKIWEFFNRHSRDAYVGNEELTREMDVKFFPNPAGNFIYVSADKSGEINLAICNYLGELVLTKKGIQSGLVDISALENGIYFIAAEQNGKVYKQKVVIAK
ncbi:MAG: hypothetical protein A2W91_18850 [Bacteroidetes bacterium GWF2_38_335]|nr:MAG: hypothetical protein A2W91_18850 [Bacteroidetes bacterium GWF2_38_335]OFY78143.1 MAG: hypothetical protein A2281_04215 [Bacteroidetes bacterium RIFOXYA12_FULL_38_20]HBS88702.1 hypothetical protein [Bacteroidales bacterium]